MNAGYQHRALRTLLPAIGLAAAVWAFMPVPAGHADARPLLLQGTIVTPDSVLPEGWVLVRDGRISRVSASKPEAPGAIEVRTGGLVFPGLIDLHNHVVWNVFPRWRPPQRFSHRDQWRNDSGYLRQVENPGRDLLKRDGPCALNRYGELRALVGGTTAILASRNAGCIAGLVRNLDYRSGFYGPLDPDSAHIRSEVNVRATTDPGIIAGIRAFLEDGRSEAFFVHLAEGVDSAARAEFDELRAQGLLTRKTAIVHGTALGPAEFQAMHDAGASLVWSPRSNVELYGGTADIPAALDAGVPVALAPDWAVTGSSNLLDELHYAAEWNAGHFGGRLTDRQLVEMVTTAAARIAGIADEAGAIGEGLHADLLVISGDREHPYRALIRAEARDVRLVLVGGEPLYGTPAFMRLFWKAEQLDEVVVDGQRGALRMPRESGGLRKLVSGLEAALAARDVILAPLTEGR